MQKKPIRLSLSTRKRFNSKVRKLTTGKRCWVWIAYTDKFGYGLFNRKVESGKWIPIRAHVFVWERAHGPVPKGKCVLHKCDNPPCCRLSHLFLGTRAENMHDMIRKGRWHARGPDLKPRKTSRRIAGKDKQICQ